MKRILKIIFYIFVCGAIMLIVTEIELRIFHIPSKYREAIWAGNTIIMFLVSILADKMREKEYKEMLQKFTDGEPTEEEFELYEDEFKKIRKKYSGMECAYRVREFIVKRRAELTLNKYIIKREKEDGVK